MNTANETVIRGAGLAGLLCALHLRRLDPARRITVVDKSDHAGGLARSPLLGGVPTNLGPRAVYRNGALQRALRDEGITPAAFVPPAAHALAYFEADGRVAALPTSLSSLLAARWLAAGEKRSLAMLLARVTVGALDVRGDEPVSSWLDRHAPHGNARALATTLVRVATYDDDAQMARPALLQLRRALTSGVLYLDDGWQSIVDGLLARCAARGVDVVLRTPAPSDAIDPHATVGGVVVPASCLDVVVDALPLPDRRFALGVDAGRYYAVHTRPGASGPLRLHVMAYGKAERATLEHMLDVVQPGWRDRARAMRFLPHMIVGRRSDGPLLADGVAHRARLAAAQAFAAARGSSNVDSTAAVAA